MTDRTQFGSGGRLSHVCMGLLLVVSMVGTLAAFGHAAVTPPLWRVDFTEDVHWYMKTPVGVLVVGTKEAIYGFDPANGDTLWRFDELRKPRTGDFEPIEYTPYAVISLKKKIRDENPLILMIDVETGEELWDSRKFGFGESYGFFPIHHAGVLLLFGKMADKPRDKVMMGVEMETGRLLWTDRTFWDRVKPDLLERRTRKTIIGHHPPVYDTDTTFILFLSGKAVCKYNIYTGELMWQIKVPKGTGSSARVMVLSDDDQYLYCAYKDRANILRTSDGQALWDDPVKLPGLSDQFDILPQGVLIHTFPDDPSEDAFQMILLDETTGDIHWKINADHRSKMQRIMGAGADATGYVIHDGKASFASGEQIHSVDIATGESTVLTKDVPIPKDEDLMGMEARDSGYYVFTNQSAALIDWDGHEVYSIHHDPPDDVGIGIGMLVAATVTDALIGGEHSLGKGFSIQIDPGYEAAYERMSRIYAATADAENYTYMLTMLPDRDDKSPGLVRIRKDDGETVGQLILDNKTPDYQLDLPWGRMFYRSGKKSMSCYKF